ncbi:DEAD-domain-containing protein, partial [Saccharata proteae CBS 121410]
RNARFAPLLAVRGLQSSSRLDAAAAPAQAGESNDQMPSKITTFSELATRGILHPNVVKAITQDMGIDKMTDVQSQTITAALAKTDIIAQARTGTGKTLGFLVPLLQNIIADDPSLAEYSRSGTSSTNIRALIISPTRELAEQIAVEANRLVRHTSVRVQTAVGGTGKREAMYKMKSQGCHILVGTPGRLQDILGDPYSGAAAPELKCLVLDEADRLLDMGFSQDIRNIQELLPDRAQHDRQTLMFSATVPKTVVSIVRQTLKRGFQFVKTIREDEEPTHTRVPQKAVQVAGLENMAPAVAELCQRAIIKHEAGEARPFKAIIYLNTLTEVKLYAELLYRLRKTRFFHDTKIFDIDSTKTQGARTTAADSFRAATSAILVSSDVTARGMDFPEVTHVIQLGLPVDTDTYIHRLGRTARAGKEGEGWLFYLPLEKRDFRFKLGALPLKNDTSLETAAMDMTQEAQVSEQAGQVLAAVMNTFKQFRAKDLGEVYIKYLDLLDRRRIDKFDAAESINRLATYGWGLEKLPFVPIEHARRRDSGRGSSDGFGGGRGSGGGFGDRRSGGSGGFGGRSSGGSSGFG